MAVEFNHLKNLLGEFFHDGTVELLDLAGDGDHYQATITSNQFKGLTKVQQHQLVYKALQGKMDRELHALALKTIIPVQN